MTVQESLCRETSAPHSAQPRPKRVVILGSTGSIGTSALKVIADDRGANLSAYGLAARSGWETIVAQALEHRPRFVVLEDAGAADCARARLEGSGIEVGSGRDAIVAMVRDPDTDIVLSAIVGAAGLEATWEALDARKPVALANKETLVVAGGLVMDLARRRQAPLLPVDSEHSAIFQAMRSGAASEVKKIVLTSSGGPFRGLEASDLADVTPASALNHPTWRMGKKISIDSATLMNKALEIIEARWLFDLEPERIDVVIHPESIIHSIVEFIDGSSLAQLSPPDMRLPIQYALAYPNRIAGGCPAMDWSRACALRFEPPDCETFPALGLGYEVARRGGTAGAALNAANEVAVARFLEGSLRFLEIPRLCRSVLDSHTFDPRPALADLSRVDARAREEAGRWRS